MSKCTSSGANVIGAGNQWRFGHVRAALLRPRGRARQRGSLFILAVVSIAVTLTIALAIMDNANATFMQGFRQPRMLALQTMADGAAQYGYWKYRKQDVTLPYTETNHTMGNGAFDVSITDNSANIAGTFQVVGTAHIHSDSYAITRIYSSGAIPLPPANLSATAGTGAITLTWTASSGATSYNVYRGTSAGGESSVPISTGLTGTSYTDSTVSAGVTYYYYVTAVGSGGESGGSNEASATATAAGYVTVTASVPTLSSWFGEESVSITNTKPITALTITVVTNKSTGLTYNSAWNNFWSGYINQTYADNGSTITYDAALNSGLSQTSGSYYVTDAFNLSGTAHSTTGDTYTVNVTAGGISQTFSGHF